MRSTLAILGLLALLACPLQAGSVHQVDASGNGDFVDLQAAVDAAAPGDVLLVHAGDYAGFVVDGKPLWIVALDGERPSIAGTVEIRNLPARTTLLVSGLEGVATAPPANQAPRPGLWIHDNVGHVRVADSRFRGSAGISSSSSLSADGGPGADCSANASLVLHGTVLEGGDGEVYYDDWEGSGRGGDGARFATSLAAVYGSSFVGGRGASIWCCAEAGDGGHGCVVPSYGLFASGSSFTGGRGGNNDDFIFAIAGDGGHGLLVAPGAQGQLLDNSYAGGLGGIAFIGQNGAAGSGTSGGGIFHQMSGAARLISGGRLAPDAGLVELTLSGEPGDQFWLTTGSRTNFQFAVAKKGVWLVPRPAFVPLEPVGTIPAEGSLTVQVPAEDIVGGKLGVPWLPQAIVTTGEGQLVLGGPHSILLQNCEALGPDCNGNGQWDVCDVLRGTSSDCDANLVPDECQPDCDGNLVADACDIAAGAPDVNGNGVPDSCEALTATWFVDPAAAPGGDGSSAFPFRTIREGIDASLSGHEVVLRDGLYLGPDNRDLDYSGRAVVVRSENGPAACIVDLELAGRAFTFYSAPSVSGARIEGITFRNGKKAASAFGEGGAIEIVSASPTIVGCVFESCEARSGGAIRMTSTSALILDCTFVANRHTQASFEGGGAIYVLSGPSQTPRIVGCTFLGNDSTGVGGAIRASGTVLISHCVFRGNAAGNYGGAIAGSGGNSEIDTCLFEDNLANRGGAIGGSAVLHLSNCTLVGNLAGVEGGAVSRDFSGGGSLRNCVLWGNYAGVGAQIALRSNVSLTVEYSDVQGGQSGVAIAGSAVLTWGAGNIDQDPLFVDPDGPDDDPATYADNDWRLGAGSPCVDAGSNALVPPDRHDLDGDLDTLEPVPFDLLGQARFVDDPAVADTGSGAPPLVDLGAFERQP